jgi:peptidylprolyl isomerase
MRKGETADFKFTPDYGYGSRGAPPKIPANSNLNFDIELINFKETQKPKWELDLPEKISFAQKYKDEGVALFKEKKFTEASEKFEEGYSYLENLGNVEITNEITEKRSALLLNLANCYNNLKEYSKTIQKCDLAVKIKENPKCYYYRGVL